MISRPLGSPARVIVLAVGIALASAGSPSSWAENPSSPDEAAGFLATLTPDPLGAGDAPMCRVDDPSGRAARVDTSAKIAQIRAMIAAEAAASGESAGEGGFVALGNRGYNYDAGALVDPSLLEFEARHQGR